MVGLHFLHIPIADSDIFPTLGTGLTRFLHDCSPAGNLFSSVPPDHAHLSTLPSSTAPITQWITPERQYNFPCTLKARRNHAASMPTQNGQGEPSLPFLGYVHLYSRLVALFTACLPLFTPCVTTTSPPANVISTCGCAKTCRT